MTVDVEAAGARLPGQRLPSVHLPPDRARSTCTRRCSSWPSATSRPSSRVRPPARPADGTTSSGILTLEVPPDAVPWIEIGQESGSLYLSLVTKDYVADATSRPSPSTSRRFPGEDPSQLTPYGPTGTAARRSDQSRSPVSRVSTCLTRAQVRPPAGGGGQVAVAVVDADQAARSRLAMQLGPGRHAVRRRSTTWRPGSGRSRWSSCSVRRSPAAPSSPRSSSSWPPAATWAPSWSPTSCPPSMLQRALRSGREGRPAGPGRAGAAGRGRGPGGRRAWSWPPRCPPCPASIDGDGELGRVITVFSTKGGAGKSVVATNLAVVLAQRHRAARSCWSTPTCSSATSP